MKLNISRHLKSGRKALPLAIAGGLAAFPGITAAAAPGDVLTTPFAVTSAPPLNGTDSASVVVSNAAGQFAIGWRRIFLGNFGEISDSGIRVRFFSPAGTPLGPDVSILAPSVASPSLGMDARGNVIAVWFDLQASTINGQRFNAAGAATGAQFVIESNYRGCYIETPQVAMDDDGEFDVTWQTCRNATLPLPGVPYFAFELTSTSAVHVRRYNADGSAKGAERTIANTLAVNTFAAKPVGPPSVAKRTPGDSVVGWLEDDGVPFLRFFDGADRPVNRAQTLRSFNSREQVYDSVQLGLGVDGNATVAYEVVSTRPNADYDLVLQRYSPAGALGNPLALESTSSDVLSFSLATAPSGNAFLVWQSAVPVIGGPARSELRGQAVSSAASPVGSSFLFAQGRPANFPSVGYVGADQVLVTWVETTGPRSAQLYAQMLRAR